MSSRQTAERLEGSHDGKRPTITDQVVAIQQLYARYGYLLDDRDWESLSTVLTDDCRFDATAYGLPMMNSLEAVTTVLPTVKGPLAHHLTDVYIVEADDRSATVRARVIGVYPQGRGFSGSYEDSLVRTDEGWRIANRVAKPSEEGRSFAPRDRAGTDHEG